MPANQDHRLGIRGVAMTEYAARRGTAFRDWCWEHPDVYWGAFAGAWIGVALLWRGAW